MTATREELGAALMWLSLQYELAAPRSPHRTLVLAVANAVLDDGAGGAWVTHREINDFRNKWVAATKRKLDDLHQG